MKLLSVLSLSLVLSCTTLSAQKVYEISAFGLKANSSKNASPVLQKALAKIKAEYKEGEKVILRFPEGRYEFHEKGAAVRCNSPPLSVWMPPSKPDLPPKWNIKPAVY